VKNLLKRTILAVLLAALPAAAQSANSAGGAGRAVLPAGAVWNGVPLSGLRFGAGVIFTSPGTAQGALQTALVSVPVNGVSRVIKVTGDVTAGNGIVGGRATFSGLGTVDPGDGSAPLVSVPFTVTLSPGAAPTVTLTLNGQTLPAALLSAGNVTVD
jgi:hypothetical protein